MSKRATITREQYLQQRKDAAKVSWRKMILPGLLFVVPFFTVITLFNKQNPPSTLNELTLFWSLCAVGLIGMIGCYYRMYADAKLNAIHCPACGKNNGGFMNSRWLIASGVCIRCKEPMFKSASARASDLPSESALLSRAEYDQKYKSVTVTMHKRAMLPLVAILILASWNAWKHFGRGETGAADATLLLILYGVLVIGMLVTMNKVKTSDLACPACRKVHSHSASMKIVLATGNCPSCGARMLHDKTFEGDVA